MVKICIATFDGAPETAGRVKLPFRSNSALAAYKDAVHVAMVEFFDPLKEAAVYALLAMNVANTRFKNIVEVVADKLGTTTNASEKNGTRVYKATGTGKYTLLTSSSPNADGDSATSEHFILAYKSTEAAPVGSAESGAYVTCLSKMKKGATGDRTVCPRAMFARVLKVNAGGSDTFDINLVAGEFTTNDISASKFFSEEPDILERALRGETDHKEATLSEYKRGLARQKIKENHQLLFGALKSAIPGRGTRLRTDITSLNSSSVEHYHRHLGRTVLYRPSDVGDRVYLAKYTAMASANKWMTSAVLEFRVSDSSFTPKQTASVKQAAVEAKPAVVGNPQQPFSVAKLQATVEPPLTPPGPPPPTPARPPPLTPPGPPPAVKAKDAPKVRTNLTAAEKEQYNDLLSKLDRSEKEVAAAKKRGDIGAENSATQRVNLYKTRLKPFYEKEPKAYSELSGKKSETAPSVAGDALKARRNAIGLAEIESSIKESWDSY